MYEALDIRIKGIVQGVGFRPFIYTLAKKYDIYGWVLNETSGVIIRAEGESENLDAFILTIANDAPKAAMVKEIHMDEVPLEHYDSFKIRTSEESEQNLTTLVSPDLVTCPECIKELFDKTNRRYRYPFINCTNCGPRFTIIRNLPYDRPGTSMASFVMCSECADEYKNPADRRFHAQPDACFECGPQIGWITKEQLITNSDSTCTESEKPCCGETSIYDSIIEWAYNRETSDQILKKAVQALKEGKILAVKGLGGFHLVCDANNPGTLALLRNRKKRSNKAFAVMASNVEQAREYCYITKEEEAQLTSSAGPIILLKKKKEIVLAEGLADGLPELGIMLPSTPLQHLLSHDFGNLLVMTSGNIHDEPIVVSNDEAFSRLGTIADAFIVNNRPIESRYDDSVVKVLNIESVGGVVQVIRRARGLAPLPLFMSHKIVDKADMADGLSETRVFAVGPEQKNTFCFVRSQNEGHDAFVSQHIGDMENVETYDAWLIAKNTYADLFRLDETPKMLVKDYHPEYLTSKWVDGFHAKNNAVAIKNAQHHHAHIVAAMAENDINQPVCGIAFDGTGYGLDGAMWGGEVLLSNLSTYERFANIAYFPLPGGAASIKNPLRCAYGVLWANDLLEHPQAQKIFEHANENTQLFEQMIEKGLNTPMSSSVGRLFDAASALMGICPYPTYEGEAAIMLEAEGQAYLNKQASLKDIIRKARREKYQISAIKNTATQESTAQDTSVILFDIAQIFEGILNDLQAKIDTGFIALKFQESIIEIILQSAQFIKAVYGINLVVLSGGVFMNRYIIEQSVSLLQKQGFTVALNKELPPNDGSISFGQAVVALQSTNEE